jgi:pyruvate formate lyase activating enzyme
MENLKGYIHSFETLGTVDGPGIRFVIFMQGCPLQCKYCHNRDTWEYKTGKQYDTDEVLKKILRSKPFIENSNGGVTVSGGEPLAQSEYLIELFKKLKEKNIHTALDTAGSIPINENIKELLKYTDLVILDIKHINEQKCIELTGLSNKNELNFARYCSENSIKIWIRQVLVPGYTDNEEDLKKTKEFINTLKTVEKVEVLPYHNLGNTKWENMGIKYPLEGVKIPTEEEILKAKEILC